MSRAVCVYCSSSGKVEPAFGHVGDEVGKAMVDYGYTLVYGGGSTGLMGRVARSIHAHGGHVLGVIPESMKTVELAYEDADELVITQTMRERKHEMDERADAFLVLPGGFGTLEELSEVITHRFLKFHNKPIVILNSDGYYDPLLTMFEHFFDSHMASETYKEMYHVTDDLDEAMAWLR